MKKELLLKILKTSSIIFIIIILFFFLLQIKKGNIYFNNKNIVEKNDDYQITINYPVYKDEQFNKKIKDFIKTQKNSFIEKVMELKNKRISHNKTYNLNIKYDVEDNKEIYSIHFIISYYLGGSKYKREDAVFYYDYKNNKELTWNDLFKDEEKTLNVLSKLSKEKLNKLDIRLYSQFDKGIKPIKENFSNILFLEKGIKVIFPPYQVAPWSTGEVDIAISYNELDKTLKEQEEIKIEEKEQTNESEKRLTRNLDELKDKKLIALTFDDGPSKDTTEQLLNGLKERNAKVTFFVLGSEVEKFPDIVKRAYNEGHTIGSHTYNHKNLVNLTNEEIQYEIISTNQLIENTIGNPVRIIRPPYGSINSSILSQTNMSFIFWNVDTEDWKNRNVDITYQNIINNAEDGQIILLHDIYQISVDAALKAIDDLEKQGYAFVSLEELEQLGRIKLDSHIKHYSFKN